MMQTITVFGGSGFIGRHVVSVLAKSGYTVRVAVRRPDLAGHLQPLGGVGQIQSVQANLRYPETIASALGGADAAINLVGILYQTRRQSFADVHELGASTIAEQARLAGLTQIIHLSALGADKASPSAYARSKAAGEKAVLDILPKSVILRPSIVFGREDMFFNKFAQIARISPILPLIGNGETKFQPVFVDDVALAVLSALQQRAEPGGVYELGGRDILSFKQCLEFICETIGRKRLMVPIPFALAKFEAWFLQMMPKPLLTVDQIRLLEQDLVVSRQAEQSNRTLADLGVTPQSIEAIVPEYLEIYRRNGQFANYRGAS